MTIKDFDDIIEYALGFLKDDYTELWVIVAVIAEKNPHFSFPEMIEATKQVISYLVSRHRLMLVNEVTEEPIVLSEREIVTLVERTLSKLNRLPNIGDGVWMTVLY